MSAPATATGTTTLKVALDWTPNTLHTGLFVAVAKRLYAVHNLAVHLLPPDEAYTSTPAKQLATGAVDLAVCPSESCIAYAESRLEAAAAAAAPTDGNEKQTPKPARLEAVYAILQRDASAVVSADARFADLAALGREGGVYGSYGARYEDGIVASMVRHAVDGNGDGDGNAGGMRVRGGAAGKLSLFEELKRGRVDATWVFLPWEGVEAELEGTGLHVFRTEDFGVPYGYSPVIARNAAGGGGGGGGGDLSDSVLGAFVKATRAGYEYAMEHPEEAAEILEEHCRPRRSKEFLVKSQRAVNEYYGDKNGGLGSMDLNKWEHWVLWLRTQNLLKVDGMQARELFTNDFFS
ncbi:hypothetical protein MBLNU459_g3561t1 [Dothideomycetes sp. NU459]